MDKDSFFVPFPTDCLEHKMEQRLARFHCDEYVRTMAAIDLLPMDGFEDYLSSNCNKIVSLFRVDGSNTMVQLYNHKNFDEAVENKEIQLVYKNKSSNIQIAIGDRISRPSHFSKGLTLLTRVKTRDGHPGKFKTEFVLVMNDCVGTGFGSCPCSNS